MFSAVGSKLADLVMNVSKSSQLAAIKFDKVRANKTKVAYNGTAPLRKVSVDEIKSSRHELGIPDEARIISIVARLREEKGHRTLFAAADIVAKSERRPIHVIVCGDGSEKMP